MANINIKNPIVTNGSSGIVTFADKIAFSYTTNAYGDYEMTKSLSLLINELQASINEGGNISDIRAEITSIKNTLALMELKASNVIYSIEDGVNITVALKIAALEEALQNASDITNFVARAETAANTTEEIAEELSEALSSVQATQEDIAKIKDIADAFGSSFDADASFAIVTKELYDATDSEDIVPNCIYFCI